MKLCEYIDYCLSRLGVEKVFGIPGSLVMPIWQSLNKEIILCSHEQEASYVATGYAKMSRKPVCVITTGGPGVTNCISGIAAANIDSIPLIYISGRTPIDKQGVGNRQEESKINRLYDSIEILNGITKQSVCINDINSAVKVIWETMKDAVKQRQGAVHISVPIDIQNEDVITSEIDFSWKREQLDSDIISISERPIFILGWGAWMSDAFLEVYRLAEYVNAPVLVSSKAYCCIKQDNNMFLGKLGYGYNAVVDKFIAEYEPDSIISFGCSLGEKDINNTVFQRLINEIPTYIVADDCQYLEYRNSKMIGYEIGDMSIFVKSLYEATMERNKDLLLAEKIKLARENISSYWVKKVLTGDKMARGIIEINNLCNNDCVLFADAGNHLANAGALIMPNKAGQLFIDVGLRAMGTGVCTAVGMAIADKYKKYVAITGDGCMLMNGNVMHLASEMSLPIVFVVFNNHSLGRVRVGQSIMNDYRGTDIKNVDFVLYAKTFNMNAYRCDSLSDFTRLLSSCINSKKASLIEMITDNDEIPVSVKDNIY